MNITFTLREVEDILGYLIEQESLRGMNYDGNALIWDLQKKLREHKQKPKKSVKPRAKPKKSGGS